MIPEGLWVLHKCDNPSCVNPNHLFLGTALDNNLDCIAKGRSVDNSGEACPAAILTNEAILDIREKFLKKKFGDRTVAKLCRLYSVHPQTIYDAAYGKTWSHI